MKRFLSIALVLTMALSLLPTAFATAADDTVSVTYDFKTVGGNWYDTNGDTLTNYTYEHTDNTWKGAFAHAGYSGSSSTYTATMNKSYGLVVRYNGTWGAVEINLPESGIYNTLEMKMHSFDSSPTDLDVYILSTETILTDELDVASCPVLCENIDMSSLYVSNENKDKVGTEKYSISKYIEAGKHYLIFRNNGNKISNSASKNSQARIYEITLSGVKATAPTATFSAVTNVDGNDVKVKVDGIANENKIISAPRGSGIVATAPSISGYKFVGWKRGSNNENDDYKSYISDKNPLEMSLLTNTFVTACYVKESYESEAVVEYYNQNGDFIDALAPTEAAPTPDAITGFTFEEGNWFIGDNTLLDLSKVTSLTRAVAKHTPNANAGTVTVNNVEQTEKAFDSEISATATAGFTCWKRDGKVVSYSKDYTYYLWNDTSIEESKDAIPESAYSGNKKLPLIVLESGNGGAYMIEYDKADFEIVEVGILFGSGNVTVDSCSFKYTSQRNSAHGQFTAKADGTAKGYLIYKDGDAYKVIYATAE